jgi:SAM-dependent methyltransferase
LIGKNGKEIIGTMNNNFPYDWSPATRGDHPHDNRDYEVDLGGGRVPKGRINVDRHGDADVFVDFDQQQIAQKVFSEPPFAQKYVLKYPRLPFSNDSVGGIISHHCLEHIGDGFMHLMDECYRVLEPGEWFRIIVPAFPSFSAVEDPEHKRYFMRTTWDRFCGTEDTHMFDAFAERYTTAKFELIDYAETPMNPPEKMWKEGDAREMRLTLRKRI